MRIIAIDPGYDRLGVAIMEKDELIFSTCIETKQSDPFHERLLSIGECVRGLINDYQPQVCAIEELFFAKNVKTALQVASARGTLIYVAKSEGLQVYEYTPNQIKIAVTGYGSASKADIQNFIPKIIKIEGGKKRDDEIDAIAVGITFFARERF